MLSFVPGLELYVSSLSSSLFKLSISASGLFSAITISTKTSTIATIPKVKELSMVGLPRSAVKNSPSLIMPPGGPLLLDGEFNGEREDEEAERGGDWKGDGEYEGVRGVGSSGGRTSTGLNGGRKDVEVDSRGLGLLRDVVLFSINLRSLC